MTAMIETAPGETPLRRAGRTTAITVALIALADYLIFDQAPGLNLFVLAIAIAAGILLLDLGRLSTKPVLLALSISVCAALPLLEAPTLTGALVALLGLAILALVRARLLPARLTATPATLLRYALVAPFRLAMDWIRLFSTGVGRLLGSRILRGIVVWVIPALFALVFVGLFASANPIIENLLEGLDPFIVLQVLNPFRVAFWLFVAVPVWALLRPRLLRKARRRVVAAAAVAAKPENLLFGHAAILRSLLLFNAMFAVQTGLDVAYLWGGVALPAGMSHADYAHRGAYPLIVTALLAAAFVLAAMRKHGPGEKSPLIRGLVYAWIAQNVLLCVSSILRLELYVAVYTLTELRIAAGIWMGLVAAGLLLILLRIALRRSNGWLIAMNLSTLTAVLYICAFIDFSALIARFNVEHSYELTQSGVPLDLSYIRCLGPTTVPALDGYIAALGARPGADPTAARAIRLELAAAFAARPRDWRSWSLRSARLEDYLARQAPIATGRRSDNN